MKRFKDPKLASPVKLFEAAAQKSDVALYVDGQLDEEALAMLLSSPVHPERLSDRTVLQLAKAAEDGKILSLPFEGLAYADKPNANSFRHDPKKLPKRVKELSKSNPPRRLMVDHGKTAGQRIGSIVSAELEDIAGVMWLRATAEIREKAAQAAFVRGLYDRFSLGWGNPTAARCSVCGAEYNSDAWGWSPACEHVPGMDGCEIIFDAEILEASFVYEGAVSGTRVLSRGVEMSLEELKAMLAELVAELQQKIMDLAETYEDDEEAKARLLEALEPAMMALTESLNVALDGKPMEEEEPEPEEEPPAAEPEAQPTQADVIQAQLKAANVRVRDLVLSQAIAARQITPAEREHYAEICDLVGVEKLETMLKLRKPAAKQVSMVSLSSEPGAVIVDDRKASCLSAIEAQRGRGALISEADLEKTGIAAILKESTK